MNLFGTVISFKFLQQNNFPCNFFILYCIILNFWYIGFIYFFNFNRRLKRDVISQLPSKTRQMVLLNPTSIKIDKEMKHASSRFEKARLKVCGSFVLHLWPARCQVETGEREYSSMTKFNFTQFKEENKICIIHSIIVTWGWLEIPPVKMQWLKQTRCRC